MTTNDSFDRHLTGWLETEAQGRVPEHLAEVLLATRATRQRRGWTSLERWLPVASITQQRFLIPRPVLLALLLTALVVALMATYLLGFGPPAIPPLGGAANGRIVYADGTSVLSVTPDGTDSRTIATLPSRPGSLAISPDGKLVGYAAGSDHVEIAAVSTDGNARPPIVVTAPGMVNYGGPTWSPSGDRIAFVGANERSDHVFIANADGTDVREIALEMIDPKHLVGWVGFSPDGNWLAFVESADPGAGRLVVVAPDGSGARTLSTGGISMGDGGGVSWSPDPATHRILYLAVGGRTQYFDLTTQQAIAVAVGFWPSWSPTGDRISYWNDGAKIVDTPTSATGAERVTEIFPSFTGACQDHPELAGKAFCGPVTWSPDGTRVIAVDITGNGLLSLRTDGNGDPRAIDLRTGVGPGEGGFIAWQPVLP
jgi:Tol biopolymer transport system component